MDKGYHLITVYGDPMPMVALYENGDWRKRLGGPVIKGSVKSVWYFGENAPSNLAVNNAMTAYYRDQFGGP